MSIIGTIRNLTSAVGISPINLLNPVLMSAAFKGRAQPQIDELEADLRTHRAFADGDAVGVVVTGGPLGGVGTVDYGAADTFDTVGDDGLSVSRTAQNNGLLGLAGNHSLGGRTNEVGIVAGLGRIGAEVLNLMPLGSQVGDDQPLVAKSCVIRGNGDFHGGLFRGLL